LKKRTGEGEDDNMRMRRQAKLLKQEKKYPFSGTARDLFNSGHRLGDIIKGKNRVSKRSA
jgi:hypothetical protein